MGSAAQSSKCLGAGGRSGLNRAQGRGACGGPCPPPRQLKVPCHPQGQERRGTARVGVGPGHTDSAWLVARWLCAGQWVMGRAGQAWALRRRRGRLSLEEHEARLLCGHPLTRAARAIRSLLLARGSCLLLEAW